MKGKMLLSDWPVGMSVGHCLDFDLCEKAQPIVVDGQRVLDCMKNQAE